MREVPAHADAFAIGLGRSAIIPRKAISKLDVVMDEVADGLDPLPPRGDISKTLPRKVR